MTKPPFSNIDLTNTTDWVENAKQLLADLIALESECNLIRRRESAIGLICQAFDAEFGFWSWGQGHPETDEPVMPIAMLFHGLSDEERVAFFQLGMRKQAEKWFRMPFLPLLKKQIQVCKSRPYYWTDKQWHDSDLRASMVSELQIDEWVVGVRYPTKKVWSCIGLFRKSGRPSFSELDSAILDLAFAGISWLQNNPFSQPENTEVSGLSVRNTEVLYLLLDGRSRKQIANALGVSTHIINDCIKQIYSHFGTTSATELAALFLKQG